MYLFVDNFRGFAKTLLQIKDVNFFVGENSTGKTSIMALLNLLSEVRFWITQKFDTEEIEFGNFEDIVSVNSPDKSYFHIGFIETSQSDRENKGLHCDGFLLTYRRGEGLPVVSRYTYANKRGQVTIRFSGRNISYKSEELCKVSDDLECIHRVFLNWVDEHEERHAGYTRVRETKYDRPTEDLLTATSIVGDALHKKTGDKAHRGAYYPAILGDVTWLAPIRTKPQRTYDKYDVGFSPEGEHTPYLIKKLLTSEKSAEQFLRFLRRFGRASGLFESIYIKKYGRSITAPFELDVILNRKALKIGNVGYGVSQSLPIIVELFARPEESWFAIQQPEIHLHPRAQVALGDVFFGLSIMEHKRFIVETHTDFIIDGFRLNYRRKGNTHKPNAQIVFFERTPRGNKLNQINILDNGNLPETQPEAYREFFVKEQMRLLGF